MADKIITTARRGLMMLQAPKLPISLTQFSDVASVMNPVSRRANRDSGVRFLPGQSLPSHPASFNLQGLDWGLTTQCSLLCPLPICFCAVPHWDLMGKLFYGGLGLWGSMLPVSPTIIQDNHLYLAGGCGSRVM